MSINLTSSVPIKPARLTNLRTGAFLTFLYNPSSIGIKKGNNWNEEPTPGFADPLIAWASGKVATVKFTLQLCAESRLRLSGVNLTNGLSPYTVESGLDLDITGEIELFQSWEMPVDPSLPGSDGAPDRLVFNMGPLFRGVVCWLYDLDINVTALGPEGAPARADCNIVLARKHDTARFASHVWTPPTEGFQT